MKRIVKALLAVILIIAIAGGSFVSAEPEKYQYTGNSIAGNSYTINNKKVDIAQFQMTSGYIAYCVDLNTYINTTSDYIKLKLNDPSVATFFSGEERINNIRGILNYAWNKTSKNDISAIQLALWTVMHGIELPSSASDSVKTTYDEIKNLTLTEADEILNNEINFPNIPYIVGLTFDFEVNTTYNTEIEFKVYNIEILLVEGVDYTITKKENNIYTFEWLGDEDVDTVLKLEAWTTRNKTINAWVFASLNENGEIDFKKSQTVVGYHPIHTFHGAGIDVNIKNIPRQKVIVTKTILDENGNYLASDDYIPFQFEAKVYLNDDEPTIITFTIGGAGSYELGYFPIGTRIEIEEKELDGYEPKDKKLILEEVQRGDNILSFINYIIPVIVPTTIPPSEPSFTTTLTTTEETTITTTTTESPTTTTTESPTTTTTESPTTTTTESPTTTTTEPPTTTTTELPTTTEPSTSTAPTVPEDIPVTGENMLYYIAGAVLILIALALVISKKPRFKK